MAFIKLFDKSKTTATTTAAMTQHMKLPETTSPQGSQVKRIEIWRDEVAAAVARANSDAISTPSSTTSSTFDHSGPRYLFHPGTREGVDTSTLSDPFVDRIHVHAPEEKGALFRSRSSRMQESHHVITNGPDTTGAIVVNIGAAHGHRRRSSVGRFFDRIKNGLKERSGNRENNAGAAAAVAGAGENEPPNEEQTAMYEDLRPEGSRAEEIISSPVTTRSSEERARNHQQEKEDRLERAARLMKQQEERRQNPPSPQQARERMDLDA